MLLYKFKGAGDALFALDIAIHERLFCSDYERLNDPFEGQFRTFVKRRAGDFNFQFGSNFGSTQSIVYPDLTRLTGGRKVCSLTTAWTEVRMWALYGDSFKGLAFEFEVEDDHPHLYQVRYVDQLPKIDSRSFEAASTEQVLSHKTFHWSDEAEWRFITQDPYVMLPGKLKRILVGDRVPTPLLEAVLKVAPPATTIHMVRLDREGICMTDGPALDRGAP